MLIPLKVSGLLSSYGLKYSFSWVESNEYGVVNRFELLFVGSLAIFILPYTYKFY